MFGREYTPITVIVNAFGRKKFLHGCIESLTNQTLSRDLFEIIVMKNFVDTEIDAYLDQCGVRYVTPKQNGLGLQIIEALSISQGGIVIFLDDDDRFKESKLEFVMKEFEMNDNLDYLHNEQSLIDESGRKLKRVRYKSGTRKRLDFDAARKSRLLDGHFINARLFHNNSSISVRKSLLLKQASGLSLITTGLDLFIFTSAYRFGNDLSFVPDRLTEYRLHASESRIKESTCETEELTMNLLRKWADTIKVILNISKNSPLEPLVLSLESLFQMRMSIMVSNFGRRPFSRVSCIRIIGNQLSQRKEAITWIMLYSLGVIFPVLSRSLYLRLRPFSL